MLQPIVMMPIVFASCICICLLYLNLFLYLYDAIFALGPTVLQPVFVFAGCQLTLLPPVVMMTRVARKQIFAPQQIFLLCQKTWEQKPKNPAAFSGTQRTGWHRMPGANPISSKDEP